MEVKDSLVMAYIPDMSMLSMRGPMHHGLRHNEFGHKYIHEYLIHTGLD